MHIQAKGHRLSDGSVVADVTLTESERTSVSIVFPACTALDAFDFAIALRDLIAKHTTIEPTLTIGDGV